MAPATSEVEAEPLYQQALAICEGTLGLMAPEVATVLENYAFLLHRQGRNAEAQKMETRVRAIRGRHH